MRKPLSFLYTLVLCACLARFAMADLVREFISPPDSARPGVYWYFMDGNQDRTEMIADLHAMNKVGIGSVLFLEVDLGMARGPVPFMSEAWQDNVAHAFVEAGRLGMEVMLGTGPGWAGSGGSWVDVSDSMQHLVASSVPAKGPGAFHAVLPVPQPHPAGRFAGMNETHIAARNQWFQDVAVIAYPAPADGPAKIDQVEIKTLRDIAPYSIRRTNQRFVSPPASYPAVDAAKTFDPERSIDLTSRLQPDGTLQWDVPEGEWTIMRFVARSTGQTTRPAPQAGHGFECDKFSAGSYRRHWNNFQQKLLDRVIKEGGPLQPGRGLTTIHLDSWEMSSQNWSEGFREQFQKRRGYDPQPFFPAWMGHVVGDAERTERFLFDMRGTAQELVLENHAGAIHDIAKQHGLLYSNEPYDMNPAGNIDLGSIADIPMCEFWENRVDTEYSCIEAASIANIMGRRIVKAEAFTGGHFECMPSNMKSQTDWALAMGINGFMFHTYQHQALGGKEKPGMTMGPYGVHWHRNQTFWDYLPHYHAYITRSSHLLRQGEAVSDILYLTPEGAPHIFEPPADAITCGSRLRDKKGHAFDACTPRILAMRAEVKGDRITFPGGAAYRVMVLPNTTRMTPETLEVIDRLVQAGATIIGNPPSKSPSLVNFPEADRKLQNLATEMWGGTAIPEDVTRVSRGRGAIYWGGGLNSGGDHPGYAPVSKLLAELGVPEDFSSPSDKIRFKHRMTDDRHIYFLSNRSAERVVTEGIFRVDGLRPELWDPMSGETRALPEFSHADGRTSVPLVFEPYQGYFILFPRSASAKPDASGRNFASLTPLMTLEGSWEVAFDPTSGGPGKTTFGSLIDWTSHSEEGIRYYSDTATYRKSFDAPGLPAVGNAKILLDLGTVHSIGRVRLNGKDLGVVWTAPWRVDVTDAIRPAGNQLEIDVANSWVNRLIGDLQAHNHNQRTISWPSGMLGGKKHGAGRYSFVTRSPYKKDSPLTPAGLLGPVSLRITGPR